MGLLDDLFEIKQAGANTQFEEITAAMDTSLSTLTKFKLDSRILEHQITQDTKSDLRADKRLSLDAFRIAKDQFKDDPVGYHTWTLTDDARDAGDAAGISNWANVIDEAKIDSEAYTDVNDFRKDFYKADRSTKLKDYNVGKIREYKSKATNLGTAGTHLSSAMTDIENSFIAIQAREFGTQSSQHLYDWAIDKGLLDKNTEHAANIRTSISAGSHLVANQLILTELKDKKATDAQVMEYYTQQRLLNAQQYQADNDVDAYEKRSARLQDDIKAYFGDVLNRQLSQIPGPNPPVESPVLGFQSLDSKDDVVIGATNFSVDDESLQAVKSYVGRSWVGDPNTLMLGDDWYVGADIDGSGKFKRIRGQHVRRASKNKLGRVKLNENPESRKKWYATIATKYEDTDDGKSSPEPLYQIGWKRNDYTTGNFSRENRIMKPVASGDIILDKKTSSRFVVVSKNYGEPTTVKKVVGRSMFGATEKTYSQYDHRKSTISIQTIDDYEKGVTDNIQTMSFHDFQRKYGLALLQLPMQLKTQLKDDPFGLIY